jgi:DNA polymerase-3 subunit gamma/tau
MVLLNDVVNKGFDGGLLIQGLARHVRNVLMAKDPQTLPLLEVSQQQSHRFEEQAKRAETRFLYEALRLMNQCDINYRQSSNKRLLVELTLIEVAQITQPDEGPASGRKPRRLKSLFKKLVQQAQPKKAAPQVAPAEQAPSIAKASEPQTSVAPSTTASPAPAAAKTVKVANIGMSWGNLRQQSKQKIQVLPGMGTAEKSTKENEEFSQDELELQWMSMCNRMPQRLSGIAARMKNMNPVITTMPNVEVIVPNEIIKDEVENIRGSILSTLKLYLHNSDITLTLRVAELKERERILTRREQFEELVKQNPSVEKLREAFDLELA